MLKLTARATFQTHQHFGECRLAAARLTNDGNRLTPAGIEIEGLIGLNELHAPAGDQRSDRAIMHFVVFLHAIHFEHAIANRKRRSRRAMCQLHAEIDFLPTQAAYTVIARLARRHRRHSHLYRITPAGLEVIAARPEVTPPWAFMRQRQLPANRSQGRRVLVSRRQRDTTEEPMRIRMLRPGEDRVNASLLHDLAGVHHEHTVTDFENEPEVV